MARKKTTKDIVELINNDTVIPELTEEDLGAGKMYLTEKEAHELELGILRQQIINRDLMIVKQRSAINTLEQRLLAVQLDHKKKESEELAAELSEMEMKKKKEIEEGIEFKQGIASRFNIDPSKVTKFGFNPETLEIVVPD